MKRKSECLEGGPVPLLSAWPILTILSEEIFRSLDKDEDMFGLLDLAEDTCLASNHVENLLVSRPRVWETSSFFTLQLWITQILASRLCEEQDPPASYFRGHTLATSSCLGHELASIVWRPRPYCGGHSLKVFWTTHPIPRLLC
jgi:hypothetical protein